MAATVETQTKSCPVVGTTNDVLPPGHPDMDNLEKGQTCPVVGAKFEHHTILHNHPSISNQDASGRQPSAAQCPVLHDVVDQPESKAMDDDMCPVVGPATTVLPPSHPDMTVAKEGDVCPVTKATVGHHKDKVHVHPSVEAAAKGAVCPVVHVAKE
ncbi:hypothetical protein P154DRAFT_519584 [Amniculicola lignicola CBS 123094]|uniref:Uncharacterized protein n=1 Tax=Amniculicola lignicola CBS 123094 TaxID=1392246 RepID=A0A6A5WQ27_9PLEO|nr:hypothetical protein P154DRAFT_519584 [Amniculicola lignicola CBS 123094]